MLLLPQAGLGEAVAACGRLGGLLAHAPHGDVPAAHARFGVAAAPNDPASVTGLLARAEERLARARGPGEVVAG
jgi:hypothetical protein